MKSNILNVFQIIFISFNLFLIVANSKSTTHEYEKIIKIYSTSQTTNLKTNTIIFQGSVILKYQNININADEIFIHPIHNKHNLPIIKAYGNPVTLCQTHNSNDTISAQSLIMHYDINNNIITLINKACIKQTKNSIHSDKITYTIKDKKIQADADQGNQVITTFFIKN